MKKRLLSLLLVGAMTFALLPTQPASIPANAASDVWDGSTKTTPDTDSDGVYQISNGAELAWFADCVNQVSSENNGLVKLNAALTDDIDLGGNPWTPISNTAYAAYAYGGNFDGGCHTISNLKITADTAAYGLFGFVNEATIKNLKVNGTVTSSKGVGGIIGKIQTGTVENCSMSGTVTSTGSSTNGYAAGIVGTCNANGATIKGCHNAAEIKGTYAGGILGYNTKSADISYCYNTGDITGSTRSGGISGQSSNGTISYCYSIGTSKNGICGFSNATITNCYYLADNTSDATSAPGGSFTGTYQQIENAASLLEALNAGGEKLFEADTTGKNSGYPVLSWQLVSSIIPIPVTTVTIQGDAITGATLTAQALGEEGKTATNVTRQWAVSSDNKTFTNLEGENGSTYTIPDTSEFARKYIKVTATGEEGSTASAVTAAIAKSAMLIERENREKVAEALESLSLDATVITEAGAINLPAKFNDCSIQWKSSNPSVVSDTGVVTLPGEGVTEVTLTATVTCGSATDTKTFTLQVWAENFDTDLYLENVLKSITWDYKNLMPVYGKDTNVIVKFQDLLRRKGYDCVAVTIESTEDESLVSKNGKVFYPAIPESGIGANGKQVQVFFRLTVGKSTTVWPDGNSNAMLIPWDTSSVKESLERSAETLISESVLCAENDSLDTVTSNLTLPSCIRGEKYDFAWITWESSDETHLAISNENRESGADSLYNPFVGKIYQDDREHTVTLTATVKNPSTDVTVVRTYEVTILPMGEEQLNQTLETMNRILACYTPDKLTDFITKKQLDTAAVVNDIQLVIPGKVVTAEELAAIDYGKYWDYWNYKFTVSSSDTDVVEINSFRAYVYRPLGEDNSADKTVTLTVKMQSKSNPNLFATKDITLSVKHLSRTEIKDALALMDEAKTSYAKGLLGKNMDRYSVIDDLTPYREIVWKEDKSGVDFIYANAEMKNNGIVVDELPDWETQEDWRLFRTSNRDLLANETLILNETPAENTFVRINSVLTDEVLGKYYTKFKDYKNYDVEALAKFRQLYKQPVNTYVMAVGNGNYTNDLISMTEDAKAAAFSSALSAYKQELEQPISVSFSLLGLDGTAIIPKTTETSFTRGATVFDVFKKVLADNNIPYTAKGSYISSINGLSEFDYGVNSGWMYTVGDVLVNSYMNAQELSGGEDIVVKYVTDYTLANTPKREPDNNNPGDNTGGDNSDNTPGDNTGGGSGNNSSGGNNSGDTTGGNTGGDSSGNNNTDGSSGGNSSSNNNTGGSSGGDSSGNNSTDGSSGGNSSSNPGGTTGQTNNKKKKITALKLTKYKRGTKKILGKTIKKAKITIRIDKKKYKGNSNKKGKFTVNLKKKLKKKTKICVTVAKKGYQTKKKTFKVK